MNLFQQALGPKPHPTSHVVKGSVAIQQSFRQKRKVPQHSLSRSRIQDFTPEVFRLRESS